jgi:catechol 2,3-dioxygenase-like lactoylglutathione lyase family enzyme
MSSESSRTGQQHQPGAVRQLRVVVQAADFAAAVAFYRDVLGLEEQAAFSGEGDAQVVILSAGQATLEIANPAQVRMIDQVEVGSQVSPQIRLAFEVDDTALRTEELKAAGATELAPPVETPWRSLNSRLDGPAGLQLTLFQELGPGPGDENGNGNAERAQAK